MVAALLSLVAFACGSMVDAVASAREPQHVLRSGGAGNIRKTRRARRPKELELMHLCAPGRDSSWVRRSLIRVGIGRAKSPTGIAAAQIAAEDTSFPSSGPARLARRRTLLSTTL